MPFQRLAMKTSEALGATLRSEDAIDEAAETKVPSRAGCAPGSFPARKSTVRMLIVYEDDLNRDRARQMQWELTERLSGSFDFSLSWWRLRSLRHPKMLQMATDAAAKTDIILFSLRSGSELPQAVKFWMEKKVISDRAHGVSLLALLETGGAIAPRLSKAEIFLSHLSSKAGVDCLCYSDSLPSARFARRCEQDNDKCAIIYRRTIFYGVRRNGCPGSSRGKMIT